MANPMIGVGGGSGGFIDSVNLGLRQDLGNYSPETQNTITSEERKRRIGNMLLQRGMQPRQGQMVGRFFVPPSKWEQGSDLAQAALGAYMNYAASEKEDEAVKQEQKDAKAAMKQVADSLLLKQFGQEPVAPRPAETIPTPGSGIEDAETRIAPVAGQEAIPHTLASFDQQQAVLDEARATDAGRIPEVRQFLDARDKRIAAERDREDRQVEHRYDVAQRDLQFKLQMATLRANTAESAETRRENAQLAAETQRQLAKMADDRARDLANMADATKNRVADLPAQPLIVQDKTSPTGYSYIDARTKEVVSKNAPPPLTPEDRKAMAETKAEAKNKPKTLPSKAVNDLVANKANIRKAQKALDLLSGMTVESSAGKTKGDKNATGFKGYLPPIILNRFDEMGVPTRAAIADVGSMEIHTRSGASVTASEFPRLQPFIPSINDKPSVAKEKLQNFLMEYQAFLKDLEEEYRGAGYNVPDIGDTRFAAVKPGGKPAAAGGIPGVSVEGIDAVLADRESQRAQKK